MQASALMLRRYVWQMMCRLDSEDFEYFHDSGIDFVGASVATYAAFAIFLFGGKNRYNTPLGNL